MRPYLLLASYEVEPCNAPDNKRGAYSLQETTLDRSDIALTWPRSKCTFLPL